MRITGAARGVLGAIACMAAITAAAFASETRIVQDGSISRSSPGTGGGRAPLLRVSPGDSEAYLQFDLTGLPPEATGSGGARATLTIWVESVPLPGAFEARAIVGDWSEAGLDAASRPGYEGSSPGPYGVVSKAGKFVSVDVTEIAKSWLNGFSNNYGIALVSPPDGASFTIHSKENTLGAHEPELSIVLGAEPGGSPGETPLLLVGPQGPEGPAGPAGPAGKTLNPRNVAFNRWFGAWLSGTTHGGGTHPIGLAFDGTYMWVAEWEGDAVRRINRRDGNWVDIVTVGVGPVDVKFDGQFIWVTSYSVDTVTKLKAFDASIVSVVPVDHGPTAIAFDGENIWITNLLVDKLTKIRPSDAAVLNVLPSPCLKPNYIAHDGANIWITCTIDNKIAKIRASDNAVLGVYTGFDGPLGIAFDGKDLWITEKLTDRVARVRTSDGAVLARYAVGVNPYGVAFDGFNVWVTNALSDSVTQIRVSDGAILGTYPTGDWPEGIAFDGSSIWVGNSRGNSITRF